MESKALAKILADATSNEIYKALLSRLAEIGPHEVDPKKTSLHVTRGHAFLGIEPRKGGLLINVVSREGLRSDRVRKAERLSSRRFHNEVLLRAPDDVDEELMAWVAEAYAMTS